MATSNKVTKSTKKNAPTHPHLITLLLVLVVAVGVMVVGLAASHSVFAAWKFH